MSKGTLFTVSAPSGAGKTSLVNTLSVRDCRIKISVSHTTRAIRPGEKEGDDYYFVDQQTFDTMISDQAFLEYAKVFENTYGTSKAWVEQTLQNGIDVILEIDWQGAQQVRTLMPQAQSIFILPPSRETLRERLQNRGQDDKEIIDQRMQEAISEMSHYHEAQWLIINDHFDRALAELHHIVCAYRLRTSQQQQTYSSLLADLMT